MTCREDMDAAAHECVGDPLVVASHAAARAALVDPLLRLPQDMNPLSADALTVANPAIERGAQLRSLWMWGCQSERREIYHKIAAAAIGQQVVGRLAPFLAERANTLLDVGSGMEAFDLVDEFARPLVRDSIMELFGIPPSARASLETKIGGMAGFIPGNRRNGAVGCFAIAAIAGQLEALWDRPLPRAAESSRILREAVQGGGLSLDEALAQATLLLFGNSYTTLDALSGLLARLASHSDIWRSARNGSISIPALVEEGLRLGPPTNLVLFREAIGQVACEGHFIPSGTRVVFPLERLNRDPDRFPDPDLFKPDRAGAPHLMFGAGRHMCVGLHLARAVIRTGVAALLDRMPEWPRDVRSVHASGVLGGPTLAHLIIPARALRPC